MKKNDFTIEILPSLTGDNGKINFTNYLGRNQENAIYLVLDCQA